MLRFGRSSTRNKNKNSIKGVPGQGSRGESPSLQHCFWNSYRLIDGPVDVFGIPRGPFNKLNFPLTTEDPAGASLASLFLLHIIKAVVRV